MVWAVCVLLGQAWAFVNFLREFPALRLRLALWEVLGVGAYVQAFAFFESFLLLLWVVLLGALLPSRWLLDRFMARGSLVVLISVAWSLLIHTQRPSVSLAGIPQWLLTWGGIYAVMLAGGLRLFATRPALDALFAELLPRLLPLALLYGAVGVLSVVVVLVRLV